MELPYYLYLQDELVSEKEYEEQDVIRKFQISYNETVCMVEKFPEAMLAEKLTNVETGRDEPEASMQAILPNENTNELHVVTPGEGKVPINLAFCKDWDAKAFPLVHLDGQNHLFDKRDKKLRDQEYFKQRLCYRHADVLNIYCG